MTATAIQKIERHAKRIRDGHEKVHPGMPASFTEACTPGDRIWQGDLRLDIVERVAKGYVRVERPTGRDLQLVPGNTEGAKHCLDSLAGVELWRPTDWPNEESLDGPCLVLTEARTILHPTHGPVHIPAGFTIECGYQREWDVEQQRERRNAD